MPIARSILQDESGLRFDHLEAFYDTTLYGSFEAVNPLFGKLAQSALRTAFATREAGPLPFKVGYEKTGGSCLIYGVRT